MEIKGVAFVGAYGSPDLPPNDNWHGYQDSCKPKKQSSGCLKNVLIGVLLVAVFLFLFYVVSLVIQSNNMTAKVAAQTYSYPTFIPPVISDSETGISSSQSLLSSAPIAVDDSTDFLQSWAKMAVLKALLYPDSAKFSDDPAAWKIARDGNVCTITSMVFSRGKNSKQITSGPFVVKIAYYDDLNAKITYISIDGKAWYDSTSSKSK